MDTNNPIALFILILTTLLIFVTIVIAGLVIKYRNNHVIKAASPLFCILSLVGVLLAYVDVYLYIGQPTDVVCAFRPVTVSFASAIFFGTMLPKTFRIYKVFRRIRALRSSINNRRLLLQSGAIISLNLLFIIIWYSIDVPRVLVIPRVDEKKFVCASRNTQVDMAFNDIMLIYHGLLIAATTFLAFKVRVARDVFNEAVSIASIICATTVLGALFVPKINAILRPTQLQSKPSEMAFSTAPSKKGSQIASSALSPQTALQTEYYVNDFYFKKNGLFAVWKPVKLSMIPFKESPGCGFLLFHDSSDTSETFQTLRIQDTKLICDESIRSSGQSVEKSSGENSDTGQPSNSASVNVPRVVRLQFADGYYDLEGKSPMAMATLLNLYASSPSVLTKGPKPSDVMSSFANLRVSEHGTKHYG
ncbi:7 transmembrane sweet-taste receptor of 3 GCPR-domain-containing protein [Paraphysoderma sedebokerense]|nr:7 transmembrane sweet-taste receptor of 3 GCPR-domain-containing protein [Paraphysoderma sedebokerense]